MSTKTVELHMWLALYFHWITRGLTLQLCIERLLFAAAGASEPASRPLGGHILVGKSTVMRGAPVTSRLLPLVPPCHLARTSPRVPSLLESPRASQPADRAWAFAELTWVQRTCPGQRSWGSPGCGVRATWCAGHFRVDHVEFRSLPGQVTWTRSRGVTELGPPFAWP